LLIYFIIFQYILYYNLNMFSSLQILEP
jgi:hypothetical protein